MPSLCCAALLPTLGFIGSLQAAAGRGQCLRACKPGQLAVGHPHTGCHCWIKPLSQQTFSPQRIKKRKAWGRSHSFPPRCISDGEDVADDINLHEGKAASDREADATLVEEKQDSHVRRLRKGSAGSDNVSERAPSAGRGQVEQGAESRAEQDLDASSRAAPSASEQSSPDSNASSSSKRSLGIRSGQELGTADADHQTSGSLSGHDVDGAEGADGVDVAPAGMSSEPETGQSRPAVAGTDHPSGEPEDESGGVGRSSPEEFGQSSATKDSMPGPDDAEVGEASSTSDSVAKAGPESSEDFPLDLLYTRIGKLKEKEVIVDRQLAVNWRTGQCTQGVVAVLDDWVRRLKHHDDILACGTFRGPVVTFRMSDAAPIAKYVGHQSEITCVDYDGKFIAAGSESSEFYVWKNQSNPGPESEEVRPSQRFRGHKSVVSRVQLCGDRVVSSSADGTIRIWSLESGRCLQVLEAGAPVLSFHLVGDYLIAGLLTGEIKAFSPSTGKCLLSFAGHAAAVLCLQYDELDLRLVTGSADGTLKSWDLRNGECQRAFGGRQGDPAVPSAAVRAAGAPIVALQFDGTKLISASRDGSVTVWDLITGAKLYTLLGHTAHVGSVQFDSSRLISDGSNNIVLCHTFLPPNDQR